MFVSNTIQEFLTMTEVLTFISTDHSPLFSSLFQKERVFSEVKYLGKLIASKLIALITNDQNYLIEI